MSDIAKVHVSPALGGYDLGSLDCGVDRMWRLIWKPDYIVIPPGGKLLIEIEVPEGNGPSTISVRRGS